jgi:hypothetical protein
MLQNMDELKITIDGIFIQCKINKNTCNIQEYIFPLIFSH